MKKLIVTLLISLIIMNTISIAYASTDINTVSDTLKLGQVIQVNGYEIKLIEETETYSKIQFTNLKTGEKEYLEKYNENGYITYVTNSKNGKYTINKVEESVLIKNIRTKEVQKLEPVMINKDTLKLPVTTNNNGWTAWEYQDTDYDSRSSAIADVSMIAAIIATMMGVPANASIALTIASNYAAKGLTDIYCKIVRYMRFAINTTAVFQEKYVYSYYENSNYTGFIGSHSEIYSYY